MKIRATSVMLMALVPLVAIGRLIQILEPRKLMADSKLVFIGRVQSVKPSGITTSLSYIPWEGVTFEWLTAEVEVMEGLKGVVKGNIIRTAMLSVNESNGPRTMYSPPGMLGPEKGDIFLLCLLPTPVTNVFAALTAPYNEDLSAFALHRNRASDDDSRDLMKKVLSGDRRFAREYTSIFGMLDKDGKVLPEAVDRIRETYADELRRESSTNLTYLEWETAVSIGGWRSDVPKGYQASPVSRGTK